MAARLTSVHARPIEPRFRIIPRSEIAADAPHRPVAARAANGHPTTHGQRRSDARFFEALEIGMPLEDAIEYAGGRSL